MASVLHQPRGSTSLTRSISPSSSGFAHRGRNDQAQNNNVNNDTSSEGVDLEAIEQQKENIQPLSSGRSAKALHSLFTSDRKVLQDELEKGHERFKKEIESVEEDGSDDPLDVYHRYVRWTLSSYPSGPSHASHLVPLLERSTRRFVHEEQYKSDIRLLKLWLLYAKYVDCPKDIFKFLEGLQCGTSLAGFYEEWALLEEQSNNLPAADKIYSLGIARRAQPLERLKKRRDAFQARMLLPRPASLAEEPSSSSSRSSTTQRSILGGSSTGPAFRGTATTQSTTKAALPNNGATAFAVFKDDGSSTTESDNALATQDNWTDFGTNASRKRENVRPAVPWKGETIPVYKDTNEDASNSLNRSRPLSLSSSMKFEVFRDENADLPATDLGISHGNNKDIGTGLSVARSLRAPPEAELLRSDPFRHYDKDMVSLAEIPELPFNNQPTSSSSTSIPKSSSGRPTSSSVKGSSTTSSRSKPSSSSTQASSSTLAPGEKRKERVASPLHEIYPEGANGPEYSFEEIRAAKRNLRSLKSGELKPSALIPDQEQWYIEASKSRTPWKIDNDGKVLLRDSHSGEALFQYLKEQDANEQEAKLANKQRKAKLAREVGDEKARIEAETAAAAAEKERVERQRQKREEEKEHLRLKAERLALEQAEEARRIQAEQRALEQAREVARIEAERSEVENRRREMEESEREKCRREEEERLRREEEIRCEERKLCELQEARRIEQERQEQARIEAEAETEARRQAEEDAEIARELFDADEDRSVSPQGSTGYRPPSPTINTKAALAEVNAMFGKTMRFDGGEAIEDDYKDDYDSSATEQSGSSESEFQQNEHEIQENEIPFIPSQAETDGSFWSIAQSQSQQQQPLSQPFSQPFSTQQSMPFDSQSSSLGFPSTSDSGETTEESDGESDLAISRRASHLEIGINQLHHSLSRSSSSSSSGISADHQPMSLQASLKSHKPAFTPFKETSENDENDIPSQRKDRNAFKPMRTPLGVKPTSTATSASKPPAFAVFSEQVEEEAFGEEDEQSDNAAGYGMGRRPAGNNRFANMMDIMTPITERTCEFGMQTATMTAMFGGEVQARMLTADQSNAEGLFDQAMPEDLASSRGSNWDAGRKLEQIDEEGDCSSQVEASQEPSGTSTVLAEADRTADTHTDSTGALDPLSLETVDSILLRSDKPVTSMQGFRDHRQTVCAKLDGLQRVAKSRRKSASANHSRSSTIHEDSAWQIELHSDVFSVREKLGEGGFGSVYRVAELLDDLNEEDDEDIQQTALKIESPPNLWEFYTLNALHARLPERTKLSIIKAHRLYAFQDESYLLLDYCDQGSLLDAVNHAHDAGIGPSGSISTGLEEVLAIFFTIELTRTLECLHTYRFLHGDFKIDNCLIRLDDVPGGAARNWSNSYKADGSGGWKHKGLSMIDFGRTVDLDNFEAAQTFITDVKTDKHDCAEVREGRPWVYQPDYFGLACIAHVLLFGKYLETQSSKDSQTGQFRYSIKEPLKRYHQANLWNRFFDLLLNPTSFTNSDPAKPITHLLKESRHDMERWLESNSDKNGKSLKGLLKKLEIWALSRH